MAVKDGPEPAAARSREGELAATSALETIGLVVGVLGLTALVFGVVLYAIDPNAVGMFAANLVFATAAILFYAVTNRRGLLRKLGGRSSMLAVMEGAIVLGVLGGLVAANYFASRSTTEWDLTSNRAFTLEEQSVKLAAGLQKQVKVVAFYRPADSMRGATEQLVNLYRRHTDKIELEFISPDRATQAELAKYKMSAQSPRIVVVGEDDRQVKVAQPDEESLTNALLQIADRPQRKIYFLLGHGEAALDDETSDSGFRQAVQGLVDDGYLVERLSLIDRENVPQDATCVVVAGPKSALFPNEVESLSVYLKRGGRVGFFLDAGAEHGLDELFRPYGISVGDDLIVDPSPAARMLNMGPDAIIIQTFEQHPIMEPLIRKPRAVLFYSARSVSPRMGVARIDLATLVRSGESSWGELGYKELGGEFQLDEGDMPGPVPLAVAVSKKTATAGQKITDEARLVVFGDSSFASNRFVVIGGNRDLFLNTVSWLAGEEERIVLRPQERRTSRLPLTEQQQYGIVFFSVNLLPLLIVGIGFSVWAVRRRK